MFAARHSTTSEIVVILDPAWVSRMDDLRQMCHGDILRCPECAQPVWTKSGQFKRAHFAHKHRSECPSSNEPPELLQGRAVLYQWLQSKYGSAVTVERKIADSGLPRHFDCWVERPGKPPLAYWIFEKHMKPEHREVLGEMLRSEVIAVVPVFLAKFMQRNGKAKNTLNLTTSEREFCVQTPYDCLYARGDSKGSLHYLDEAKETLTTFRAMYCMEPPQQYLGDEMTTPLADVQLVPRSGQFVHPEEHRKLGEREARIARQRQRRLEIEAEQEVYRQREAERYRQELAEKQKLWEMIGIKKTVPHFTVPVEPPKPPPSYSPPPVEPVPTRPPAPCESCGQLTPEEDQIVYNGATKTCRCRKCMK